MKKVTLIIFLFLSVSGLKAQKAQSVFKLKKELKKIENVDSLLNFEIEEVNRLYERSVFYRVQMINFAEKLKEDPEKPLGAHNINFIKGHTNDFMRLRDSLYAYTFKYENAMKLSQYTLRRKHISELERTKAVMLSTACALILYDNYMSGVVLLEQDDRVRRIANDPDIGFDVDADQLTKVSKAANSIRNQKRIIKGIEFLERREKMFANETDEQYLYLRDLIYSSPSRDYLKRTDFTGLFSKKIRMTQIFVSDLLAEVGNSSMNEMSKLFGNTAGMVEMRKGKMYRDSVLKLELLSELQPLDILLEKTPFRLTDKFIPGYFGHVAIWVGNGEDIEEMGLWDHKVIRKYQDEIAPNGDMKSEDGAVIVEALREGVKLSSLDEFLNVDDFVILRPVFQEGLSDKQKKESLLLTFRQLGKEYDFNFDIDTSKKIVCSELAYICYPKIDFFTEKMVGRHTISPDNVATMVWESDQIELVSFYHDGKKCDEEEMEQLLKKLVTAEQ